METGEKEEVVTTTFFDTLRYHEARFFPASFGVSVASEFRDKHVGCVGVVIGNGESRLAYDLFQIPEEHVVMFACNAYYRDAMKGKVPYPDYLVAVDPRPANEILRSGYAENHWFWVPPHVLTCIDNNLEKIQMDPPSRIIESDYAAHFFAGIEAIQFAWITGCDPVVLIGFDGPSNTEESNNVYKGTENYVDDPKGPATTQKQLKIIWRRFPGKTLYQVGTSFLEGPEPLEFESIDPLSLLER